MLFGGSPSNRANVVSEGSTYFILLELSFALPDCELVWDDEGWLLELDRSLDTLLVDMSEELDSYDKDSDCSVEVANTELIYKYTESLLKSQSESLNRLDTKLSAFLAFTGVLVRFVGDLSGKVTVYGLTCYSCTFLQILAYISLGASALLLMSWTHDEITRKCHFSQNPYARRVVFC